jgi:hypothetical protein
MLELSGSTYYPKRYVIDVGMTWDDVCVPFQC